MPYLYRKGTESSSLYMYFLAFYDMSSEGFENADIFNFQIYQVTKPILNSVSLQLGFSLALKVVVPQKENLER